MKKRMAKIMSAVLVSAMAVSMMAGCGSDKKETTGSGSSTQSTGAVDTSDVMSNEETLRRRLAKEKSAIGALVISMRFRHYLQSTDFQRII